MTKARQAPRRPAAVAAAIGLTLCLGGRVAPAAPPAPVEHRFIAEIRSGLRPQLRPRERARLDAVDGGGTATAGADRLVFLAADRAVRRLTPLALTAARRPEAAARLRGLPPIVDPATARGAQALLEQLAAQGPPERGTSARPLGCSRPLVHAGLEAAAAAAQRDEPATSRVPLLVCATLAAGAPRAAVIEVAVTLVAELAAAARAAPSAHP